MSRDTKESVIGGVALVGFLLIGAGIGYRGGLSQRRPAEVVTEYVYDGARPWEDLRWGRISGWSAGPKSRISRDTAYIADGRVFACDTVHVARWREVTAAQVIARCP